MATDLPDRQPKIVMLGGGTGTYTVLSALKHHTSKLTAVVNMVDDGGSTGQLRDELGVLPPGDIRQSLVALSSKPQALRDLFNYRFDEGSLSGHAFGNLFLTALEKSTGSFTEAVKVAGQILAITGRVVPVTTDDIRLVLRQPDGELVFGQHAISEQDLSGHPFPELWLEPAARLNPDAARAIAKAEVILLGPGNVYASLLPVLLVDGMVEALQASTATKIYVCNLVTKPGQTDGYRVHDFVNLFELRLGPGFFDTVVYNTSRPPASVLERYARQGELWVAADDAALARAPYRAVGAPLVAGTQTVQQAHDPLARTLIRHDSEKLAELIMSLTGTSAPGGSTGLPR